MKKIYLLLVLALSAMTISAQDTKTGFRFGIETGVGFGDYTSVAFDFTPGAQINKYVYVGGGLGLDVLTDGGELQIPIFAQAKGFLPLQGAFKPYLDLRGGYAIGATEYAPDGGLLNIGAGVEFRNHWNLSIGYAGRFYSTEYRIIDQSSGTYETNSVSSTASNGYIKIGYRF